MKDGKLSAKSGVYAVLEGEMKKTPSSLLPLYYLRSGTTHRVSEDSNREIDMVD